MQSGKYKSLHIRPEVYEELKELAEVFNTETGTKAITPAEAVSILIKKYKEKK